MAATKRPRLNALQRTLKRADQLEKIAPLDELPVLLEAVCEHRCSHCGAEGSLNYVTHPVNGTIVIYCSRTFCKVKPADIVVD